MPSALLTRVLVDIAPWLPTVPRTEGVQVSKQSHDRSHYWHEKQTAGVQLVLCICA
jgi:hypothetical protein